MGPAPAVAEVRRAVRRSLREIPAGQLVVAACSGGPDSLALSAALAFEAPRSGHRAGALTVDHGLQVGSAERAAAVVAVLRGLGLEPVRALAVSVAGAGGPEAAARRARYAALADAARQCGAAAILLGHTRDDQAETVLLGLARGAGARSLAGMPPVSGHYRRPLLGTDRATTRAACAAMGLHPWEDPHNTDPAFARSRVRHDALPVLEAALGPGVAAALARSAWLLRDDADALDTWAEDAEQRVTRAGGGLDAAALAELPAAVRRRVLRRAAAGAGSPPGALGAVHVDALDQLLTAWRGQRHVDLPGGVLALRRYGTLLFEKATPEGEVTRG